MDDKTEKLLEDTLIYGGIALGAYFGIVRPILQAAGIDDPANVQTVNNINTLDPSENPFSYLFQPLVDYYQPLYDQQAGGSAQAYWQGYKQAYDAQYNGNPPALGTTSFDIAILSEQLKNAISFWHTPDSATITGIFNLAPTQRFVASMGAYFQFNFNVDLLTFLKGGKVFILVLQWGLTDNDLANIVNHVLALPADS
jgi:hypothetical protein